MSDLTPEDIEHFASGVMPHERPSAVDEYRDVLRVSVRNLQYFIDRDARTVWIRRDDVIALIDEVL